MHAYGMKVSRRGQPRAQTTKAIRARVISRLIGIAVVVALLAAAIGGAAGTTEFDVAQAGSADPEPISGQYIVVFSDDLEDVAGLAATLVDEHGGELLLLYEHALKGFAASGLTGEAVDALLAHELVQSVAQDFVVPSRDVTVQEDAPWGLDRIDQRALPLTETYSYTATGAGVNIYIIDSGIRSTHEEFGGRVTLGADFATDDLDGEDCNGHGTHVAGIAAGETFGVAKEANIINVRVGADSPDCGAIVRSRAIAGIDWVVANAELPAVVNMSFGWTVGEDETAEEQAVKTGVENGIVFAGATENVNRDGCDDDFPSRIAESITVSNSRIDDSRRPASGFGACIDIYAPGTTILSAWWTSDNATSFSTGTSMATPHVVGVAALYLEKNPTATPAQVMNAITSTATVGVLTGLPAGTPNRLLYSRLHNQAPVADHGGPYSGDEGSPVAFDATGSFDPDGDEIVSYEWDFGDGNTGTGATPTNTYLDNGVYTVSVTVWDGSLTHTAITTATIANVAPTVNAGPDATVESNELFSFSGTFSDPGILDAPWTWAIDWGDGETTNGSTNNQALPIVASHAFCAASDYTVTLTVTDKDGGSGFDTMTVTVEHIAIRIIIRPSASPNPISLRTGGVIPVAVLSTADFDATTIDPATATLGDGTGPGTGVAQRPNGTLMVSVEDVDGDGLNDLVLHFSIPQLIENGDLSETTTELHLEAFLADGCSNVRGTDEVTIVP
jgi:subtilisin family serine protease